MSISVEIPTHDGGHMPGLLFQPRSGSGPGLVLLQEIFGLTDYITSRAERLAQLGCTVLAPELYWRIGEHLAIPERDEAGLQAAFGYVQKLDQDLAVGDGVAALEFLKARPETGGKAGVFGFCLGGRLAYQVAARSNPDVLVSYYGSGIAGMLDQAGSLGCASVFHFGARDQYLPLEDAERIHAAVASLPDTEVHIHRDAGHAFDNPSPLFHSPNAAAEAWEQTVQFLRRHLIHAGV